jgi:hypothetical protein
MADLIDYLDKLNAERAHLSLYARRLRKVKWLLPGIVKDLMKGLEDQWREVTEERQRTLEVIEADPALRFRMREREESAALEARQRMVARHEMTASPGRPHVASEPVREIGRKVVALEREEARRQHFLDEVYFYYGSNAWQNDGVEIGKLDKLIQECELDRDCARLAHHRVLDGLHTRIQLEAVHRNEPVSMLCANLLGVIRAEVAAPERDRETPLSRFLEKERPRLEDSREPKRSRGPSR